MANGDKRARAATIHDVAAAAGVSARTVSRVINRSPKVGEETRKAIEAVIAQLGFSPNSRARGLSAGRSNLIGVVQDDPNAHVIGIIQRGIVDAAREPGYELIVHPADRNDPALLDNIRSFIAKSRVDGLILLPPISERADVAAALGAMGLPCVGMAAIPVDGYGVAMVSDERGAAAEMAGHLADLGHRRIATVTGPREFQSSRERETGFRAALEARGIDLPPAYVVEGDYGFASGLAAGERLLALADRPTAIFAGNDMMAAGVMKAGHLRGLRVPDDLSVAGFDDSDLAAMLTPDLTTIRRPLLENARRATRALIEQIEQGEADTEGTVAGPLLLVVRGSTGRVPV
ncbi:LacI family DNA-binding transcriptional regulator [Sphingobium bisphenolivorans]|uniref:LacI family DNA-binding transcriptional regulator n=1 Tax=Sphingobium bisphenolivorans TaxID=1335760 RepID=UPI0003A82F14|nr:LacI family DNA-binding transcriptional regulator [Sphingobium bisphenolivorans]